MKIRNNKLIQILSGKWVKEDMEMQFKSQILKIKTFPFMQGKFSISKKKNKEKLL